MIGALPGWLADSGSVIGITLAFCLVLGALSAGVAVVVRAVMKPSLDKLHKRIDDHMGEEESTLNRVAFALEIIAEAVGVKIPGIIVSGGSDEGDTDE